jgi:hypothetical protein
MKTLITFLGLKMRNALLKKVMDTSARHLNRNWDWMSLAWTIPSARLLIIALPIGLLSLTSLGFANTTVEPTYRLSGRQGLLSWVLPGSSLVCFLQVGFPCVKER